MSRPSEIANSLLHRYYNQKQENLLPTSGTPRPKRIQSVTSIQAAEKFRSFVIRDISQKVTKINDPSVSESQIRDLNDQINKLVNEKLSWEHHIKELGGPDYVVFSKRQLSKELSIRNYRYFGRAKELSDTKDLIELKKQNKVKSISNEKEILKYVNDHIKDLDLFEYYGLDQNENPQNALVIDNDQIIDQIGELRDFPYISKREVEAKNSFESKLGEIKNATDGGQIEKYSFDEFNPPSMEDIEKVLVERKKSELKKRLGI